MRIYHKNPIQIVKRAYWLAWKACGHSFGLGILQDRGNVTEEDVWQRVRSAGDYGENAKKIMRTNEPGKTYGDYVFGRMMKLGFEWGQDWLEFYDETPRLDYQAWCCKYPTYEILVNAAIASLVEEKEQLFPEKLI